MLERNTKYAKHVVLAPPVVPPRCCDCLRRGAEMGRRCGRRGLLGATRLVVGVPMLSSGGNLAFWAQLCDAAGCDWTAGAVARWRQAEADMGGDEFKVTGPPGPDHPPPPLPRRRIVSKPGHSSSSVGLYSLSGVCPSTCRRPAEHFAVVAGTRPSSC